MEQVIAATGWPLRAASAVSTTPLPTGTELRVLRDLNERTAKAHAGQE
jgi:glutaconate CoA-transferase subunit B